MIPLYQKKKVITIQCIVSHVVDTTQDGLRRTDSKECSTNHKKTTVKPINTASFLIGTGFDEATTGVDDIRYLSHANAQSKEDTRNKKIICRKNDDYTVSK